jgi:transposase
MIAEAAGWCEISWPKDSADVASRWAALVDVMSPGSAVTPITAFTVVAPGLVGHAGAMTNCRNAAAFAVKCRAAPVPCWSGRHIAVRLGGDRQLNRLLPAIAMTQVRTPAHPDRLYYERKRSEGKVHRSALRCLKRQLATVVYCRLRVDIQWVGILALH